MTTDETSTLSTGADERLLAARKMKNAVMLGMSILAAIIAISALLFVLAYLVVGGAMYVNWHVITTSENLGNEALGGLKNSIVGSMVLIGVASCIGLPIGILGGVYQLESKGRFAYIVRFLTDVLNSVPSIIIGIFIFILVVVPVAARHPGSGQSALAGGLALAVIMIPTVMRTTEEILRLVPTSLREGSLALGATRSRTMFSIVLPAARSGIITGIMLALARIAGETAPLLFTSVGSSYFSVNLNQEIDSLPTRIWQNVESGDDSLRNLAMAAALILIVMIFLTSVVTRLATSNKLLEEK